MYVVYDSPLQMISDDRSAYEGQSGFDFIKAVPAAWDETRFLAGTPESFVALAHRKRRPWYVGVMTNADGRPVKLPPTFLGKGAYTAKMCQDGADANSVFTAAKIVGSTGSLSLDVKPAGGSVVVLIPQWCTKFHI